MGEHYLSVLMATKSVGEWLEMGPHFLPKFYSCMAFLGLRVHLRP